MKRVNTGMLLYSELALLLFNLLGFSLFYDVFVLFRLNWLSGKLFIELFLTIVHVLVEVLEITLVLNLAQFNSLRELLVDNW